MVAAPVIPICLGENDCLGIASPMAVIAVFGTVFHNFDRAWLRCSAMAISLASVILWIPVRTTTACRSVH
jgi:hypothetical protein